MITIALIGTNDEHGGVPLSNREECIIFGESNNYFYIKVKKRNANCCLAQLLPSNNSL